MCPGGVNKHAHECPLLATSLKLLSHPPFAGAGATQRRGGVAVSHILGGLRSPQRPATQHGAVQASCRSRPEFLEDIAGNEGGPVRKVGF
jgi:hypothetical protein